MRRAPAQVGMGSRMLTGSAAQIIREETVAASAITGNDHVKSWCTAYRQGTWRHILRQCASDWMTLGPAMRKNGAAAWSSRNRSEYCRPRAGSLCASRACVACARTTHVVRREVRLVVLVSARCPQAKLWCMLSLLCGRLIRSPATLRHEQGRCARYEVVSLVQPHDTREGTHRRRHLRS